MSQTLESLRKVKLNGYIGEIDYHFAAALERVEDSEKKDLSSFLGALISSELGKGNTCIKLDRIKLDRAFGLKEEEASELFGHIPPKEQWENILEGSLVCSEESQTPLIINSGRLYLNKYWRSEKRVSESLVQLASSSVEINTRAIKSFLNELFPRPYSFLIDAIKKCSTSEERIDACCDVLDIAFEDDIIWQDVSTVLDNAESVKDLKPLDTIIPEATRLDWQKIAVASSLSKQLCFITGGPGTGKTTTVIKLLASIIYSHAVNNRDNENYTAPTIKLVAPTGKAAMRLTESIGGALQVLDIDDDIAPHIPTQASTLHRLLGATKGASKFRFNDENKLHLDVLVVDEASMVDLPMIFSLVCALPSHAKVIFLGDKDQLASVEAGSVLADFCSFSRVQYSLGHENLIEEITDFKTGHSPKATILTDCISEPKKKKVPTATLR